MLLLVFLFLCSRVALLDKILIIIFLKNRSRSSPPRAVTEQIVTLL